MGIITKLFGTHSQRELKKIEPVVDRIEALEPAMQALTDAQLAAKTQEFKARLAAGETLDDILPEAFAVAREASVRVLGQRPYRVQLIGGIVLHQGRIAEMKTGEGKTLVATLPAYLNALAGKGVHIVTVNDYLATRDSEWMGKIHRFLGLKVGLIVHGLKNGERREAYAADITYGTNNEFGFDYLRDNMATYSHELVQRGHSFAIVDEVDSILIDEARTPLIISGRGEESSELYKQADAFAARLKKLVVASADEKAEVPEDIDADYIVDEKSRSATLTARGISKAEQAFDIENLYDMENSSLYHYISNALKARGVMKRDIDYVVHEGEVVIVDEFTGRLMFGRRYNQGLHQAIEAKEGVDVANESRTLATITYQNYFRLYSKLSGMTGTALTEEEEFGSIYRLDIVEVPTNKPVVRLDHPDVVYKNENGKNRAIIAQIEQCHAKGQPVLVGTVSIEKSEYLSALLKRRGVPHNVLNAKQHEREAEIVAQAGKVGAVTIATNMAGRGTDISLGGNPEFMAKNELRRQGMAESLISETTGYADTEDAEILAARAQYRELYARFSEETGREAELVRERGGLFILGTERHESRRIDNQLRGRAGRQGDPGESRFFLAMTDDIMRLFGTDSVKNMMDNLGVDEDMPIDHKILSNAIESAQKRVESRNFQARKTVLEYDDVMNKQRELIYDQRRQVLGGENMEGSIRNMLHEYIASTVNSAIGEAGYFSDRAQFDELMSQFEGLIMPKGALDPTHDELSNYTPQDIITLVTDFADKTYDAREAELGLMPGSQVPLMRELERVVLLRVVDEYWMDHIDAMQELRQGVSLRAYGQTKPIDAYRNEGYDMFDQMIAGIRHETVRRMLTARVKREEDLERKKVAKVSDVGGAAVKKQPVRKEKKPGRNEPCPCGKWKADGSRPLKYKECCGRYE